MSEELINNERVLMITQMKDVRVMKNIILVLLFIGSFSAFANLNWSTEELADHLGYMNYADVGTLTNDEKWAVSAYGFTDETGYQDINGYLRYGDSYDLYNQTKDSVTKLIRDIFSTANKLPRIPKGLVVYRGFRLNFRKNKCFQKGEILTDKTFTSTTLSQKVANHFAFKRGSGKGAFLKLKIVSEQKGILITEYNEAEVLLIPNRKISITSSYEKDDKCFAEGELK